METSSVTFCILYFVSCVLYFVFCIFCILYFLYFVFEAFANDRMQAFMETSSAIFCWIILCWAHMVRRIMFLQNMFNAQYISISLVCSSLSLEKGGGVNAIRKVSLQKAQHSFPKRGGAQRPFGVFPKIHPNPHV